MTYKCHTIQYYDRFKIELRKIESEVDSEKPVENQQKSCKVAINTEKVNSKESEEKIDLKEMKELMKQLNDRIQKLEEKDHRPEEPQNLGRGYGRGFVRDYRGNNRGGIGRGYRPSRPWAGNTFTPKCFNCNEFGHMKRNCPN